MIPRISPARITVAVAIFVSLVIASPAQAAFGISRFDGFVENADGTVSTQAGGHPFAASTIIALNAKSDGFGGEGPDGSLKDVAVGLPAGLVGVPAAVPQCPNAAFTHDAAYDLPDCPNNTVVGIAEYEVSVLGNRSAAFAAVYNLTPPHGSPAQFGFAAIDIRIRLNAAVRTGGDYGIDIESVNTPQGVSLMSTKVTLWGVPAESVHDPRRGSCLAENGSSLGECPSQAPLLPFLRNSTDCAGPVLTTLRASSWQQPADEQEAGFISHDGSEPPVPVGIENCEAVPFSPSIVAEPESRAADSPTGLAVDLRMPQVGLDNPTGIAEADLRKAVVTLPDGMSVNPSSASGLGACSEAQIGLSSSSPATCPNDSKIGAVEIHTPLLDHPVKGGVFLARQGENKFGSLLAVYIAVNDPQSGVVIKLPGRIETSASGRVTATFDNNPQLPFEDLAVEFFGGPRAALVTPPTCGTYTTTGEFTPWSGTPPVNSQSSFDITSGPNGSPCPNGSFNPKLEAGTTNPVAGKYSPFVLNLSREDGTQRLSTITAALPKGLLGKLAGIPYCSDSALGGIPSAEGTGAAQLANPSCPAASQLGTVSVGAGAGPSPFYVNTGKVYLAGPYKGAPLSLAIVTPALAGPFDLGNVVVRAALQVNPETTQITAVSDPLPTILHGIPLDLRSVAVNISREGFTLNPTSCNPMEVGSTITGTGGAIAHPSSRFQVASCESLGFAPKLALNLKGGTTRAKNPALKAVLTAPAGQANIGKVQVILPKSVFIDSRHVDNPCTRVQFNEGAGNGSACPAKSILGKATAYSPLLSEPLKGNVYFRSNGGERKLPDLVASLNGQIHVNLVGFIDSVKQKGKEGSRVRNTFASVPDAPVSRFVLELQGGKKGLLQNSTNLCKTTNKATVKMDGQNGKVNDFETVVKPACGQKSKAKKPKKK